jgi:DUF1365 family protein
MNAQLFFGGVTHARLRPRRHDFRYRVFFVRLRLEAIEQAGGPLFSVNRWNLFSFHYRDHGARDGSPPGPWIRRLLAVEGVPEADGEVWLQTFPRVLGYVFNPVSFWLCMDREGALRAVVSEVSNTFGERHCYLLVHPDRRPIRDADVLTAHKVLHVSPFCEVIGNYAFRFRIAGSPSQIGIDYDNGEGKLLVTSVWGRPAPMTTGNLARAFVFYPWMTIGIIAGIHWQALKLWIKGVPWFSKPLPAKQELTR